MVQSLTLTRIIVDIDLISDHPEIGYEEQYVFPRN